MVRKKVAKSFHSTCMKGGKTDKDDVRGDTHESESDASLEWEDFFGSSVDISSALLDMYDRSVSKEPKDPASSTGENDLSSSVHGVQKETITSLQTMPSSRPRHNLPTGAKLHLSLSPLQGKDCPRPLSSSSLSSSSSSSSSSPRRDSKKLYLASIESLDDEFSEDCSRRTAKSRDHSSPDRVRNKAANMSLYEGSQSNCSTQSVASIPLQTSGSRNSSLSHTDRVILEIMETERTYVQDLQEIIEGYLLYIPGHAGTKVDIKSLTDLFCNIEDIYNFNRGFLQDLEMCGLDSVAVARCFFKHSYGFSIYTQYCTNYPRTVSILTDLMRNLETAEVFKERQIALCHNLPLGSYLLKPVQRILRYRLLLENIVKTSNKDCEGYADIKNALSVMTGIAYHINDMKKRHENAIRVQEIQSLLYGWDGHDLTTYGELVAEGAFRMYRTKTLRHLFIFDKMLLIVKKKEEGILCYKTHIMCSNLMLIESIQGEPLCFHVIPFDNPREQHTFQARNAEQKREWCLQLKRVILENYNAVIPSHARQLVMELGQSKQEGSVPLEKSSSKRQLSAPEYLEKRKQERRKSESNLKPFKIKKGVKKVRDLSPSFKSVVSGYESHSHQSLSASYDGMVNSKESAKPHGRWRRASVDAIPGKMNHSNDEIQRNFGTPTYADACVSDSEKRNNVHFPFHFKEYSTEKEKSDAVRRQHKSLPEETTDTENDDLLYFRPPPQTLSVSEEIDGISDVGGEYVTFYFTNNHAQHLQREVVTPVIMVEDNYDDGYCTLSPNMFLPDPTSSLYVGQSSGKMSDCSSCSNDSHKTSNNEMKISADYDNLVYLWTRLGTIQINSETDNASECSAHTPALRRVHSFTGTEDQGYNFSSRENNSLSFRQSNSVPRNGNSSSSLQLPCSSDVLGPPSPSPYVSEQEDYVNSYTQKSVSLPWDFHTGKEAVLLSPSHAPISISKAESPHYRSVADSFLGSSSELNAATDKAQSDDFVADLEKYIENAQEKKQNSCFPVNEREFLGNDSYSDRGSTLYNSTVSINSLSLNHKLYQEEEEKCSVKTVLCSGSPKRISAMKQLQDKSLSDFHINNKSSSFDDNSNKSSETITMGAKFVQSLGKAYSAMVKQKNKGSKSSKAQKSQVLEKNSCLHMPGSSAIGARVAYPLDSEYCMLDNFLPLRKNKGECAEALRPDSLLSASSNITSSCDSDKMLSSCSLDSSISNIPNNSDLGQEEFHTLCESSMRAKHTYSSTISMSSLPKIPYSPHVEQSEFMSDRFPDSNVIAPANSLSKIFSKDDGSDYGITSVIETCGDSPSENSDISGDSYYEKTFEAIENELIEQMYRDSAIYSDPDELDLNAITHEQNISPNMNDEVLNSVSETVNLPSTDYNTSVLNMVSAYAPVKEDETTSHLPIFQPERRNLFTRPVNKNIKERLECLKNQNYTKNNADSSSLKGLKSIQERWKELEQWQNSNVGIVNSESNDDFTVTNNFPDSKMNSNDIPNDENSQPKGKGWVKHVVRKLQNETS